MTRDTYSKGFCNRGMHFVCIRFRFRVRPTPRARVGMMDSVSGAGQLQADVIMGPHEFQGVGIVQADKGRSGMRTHRFSICVSEEHASQYLRTW
jgi:hypothetical protein